MLFQISHEDVQVQSISTTMEELLRETLTLYTYLLWFQKVRAGRELHLLSACVFQIVLEDLEIVHQRISYFLHEGKRSTTRQRQLTCADFLCCISAIIYPEII